MNRKTTLEKDVLFLSLIGLFIFPSIAVAQTDLTNQGFDLLPIDTWNYTSTLNTGEIATNTTRFAPTPNSPLLGEFDLFESHPTNFNPSLFFNNKKPIGYVDVKPNIAFFTDGTPDNNETTSLSP